MKFLGHHMDPAFLVFLLFVVYAWFVMIIAKLLVEVIREFWEP